MLANAPHVRLRSPKITFAICFITLKLAQYVIAQKLSTLPAVMFGFSMRTNCDITDRLKEILTTRMTIENLFDSDSRLKLIVTIDCVIKRGQICVSSIFFL